MSFQSEFPPLNERRDDIPYLVRYFLKKYNTQYKRTCQISNEAIEYLKYQDYHGNIRELQNYIERIVLLTPNNSISLEVTLNVLSGVGNEDSNTTNNQSSLKVLLEGYEKSLIKQCVLELGDYSKVCNVLGISQPTLSRRLAYYDIK